MRGKRERERERKKRERRKKVSQKDNSFIENHGS